MAYMKDKTNRRLETVELLARTDFQGVRGLDFPGSGGIPVVDSSVATVALSAANASSAITNRQFIYPAHEKFRVIGANPKVGTQFPDTNGWLITAQWAKTTPGPWAIEFDLDTVNGVFEVITKGSGQNIRTLVNDRLVAFNGVALSNDGQGYLHTVTLPSGGNYRIRLEFSSTMRFWGINIGPTDLIEAGARKRPRYPWVGDSFAEPTISDTAPQTSWMGMTQVFGYCTGLEIVPAGSGGTGFMNPGPNGTGRVKFRDRLPEVLAFPNLDGIIFQMTGNDQNYATADVMAELQACIAMARAAGLSRWGQVVVVSTWWTTAFPPASLLDKNDAARELCATLNVPFVDTLTPSVPSPVSGTITEATSTGSNNIKMSFLPPARSYLKFGSGSTLEVRQVANPNLTGASSAPYTVQVDLNPSNAHPIGDLVVQVGASLLSGTGKMSAPTGIGNADRMTGPDGTHASIVGHRARGINYASGFGRVLTR